MKFRYSKFFKQEVLPFVYKMKMNRSLSSLYPTPVNIIFKVFFCLNSLVDIVVQDFVFRHNYMSFRYGFFYTFLSLMSSFRYNIFFLKKRGFLLNSLVSLFSASNWSEREVWDFFGIGFFFHPDLRRILNDYGFCSFPLRKDFPVLGFNDIYFDIEVGSLNYKPFSNQQPSLQVFFDYPISMCYSDFFSFIGGISVFFMFAYCFFKKKFKKVN